MPGPICVSRTPRGGAPASNRVILRIILPAGDPDAFPFAAYEIVMRVRVLRHARTLRNRGGFGYSSDPSWLRASRIALTKTRNAPAGMPAPPR